MSFDLKRLTINQCKGFFDAGLLLDNNSLNTPLNETQLKGMLYNFMNDIPIPAFGAILDQNQNIILTTNRLRQFVDYVRGYVELEETLSPLRKRKYLTFNLIEVLAIDEKHYDQNPFLEIYL